MRIQRTYYEVMGLPRDANAQQVKAKYHELARQFHPDRATDKALAERLFVQINLAYRTLSDTNKRAVYDASLFQSDAATSRPAAGAPASATATASTGASTRSALAPQQPIPTSPAPPPRPKVNVVEIMGRANAAYMGGDRITTHKLAMEVLRAEPNNAEAHALLGDVYADQGRRPDALTEYRTAQRAGDNRVSLQAKIKRMEGLVAGAAQGAQPTGGATTAAPAGSASTTDPKKSGFLDRFTKKS